MNIFLEKLYEQLGENHSVVYLNKDYQVLGWIMKKESGLVLHCDILSWEEIINDNSKEIYEYLTGADEVTECLHKEDLYKVLKRSIKIYVDSLNKDYLKEFDNNLGKYYKLYTGTCGVLIGVSSTDEDFYNIYLTQDLKLVYSSAVGVPKEISDIPFSPLKDLIDSGELKKYAAQAIEKVNKDYTLIDYVFASL